MHRINALHLGGWVKFYALSFVFLLSVFHTVHIIIMTVESPPIDKDQCYVAIFSSYAICLL